MRIYLIVILIALFSTMQIFAQQPKQFCGTVGKSPWLQEYQKNRLAGTVESGADSVWLYVPVTFHLVRTTAGISDFHKGKLFEALCRLNEQYSKSYIKFYLHPTLPFNTIDNSEWYVHDWEGGSELITQNNLPDRVNAYIVSDPAGNCGYSWQDAIVLANNCSGPDNSTWAHELGHHLSLPHPFFGWEGVDVLGSTPAPAVLPNGAEVETVERTNCLIAGDGFCDTEPDYISNRWNCQPTGSSNKMIDPKNIAFRVDSSYLMGYALDACQSRFMPDQIEAMRANLRTEHSSYLVETQHGITISDDSVTKLISPIDSVVVQYDSVIFTWQSLKNAEFYVIEIGLLHNNFPILYRELIIGETSFTYPLNLYKNKMYYWRIKAYNDWDFCFEQTSVQDGVFKAADLTATQDLEKYYQVDLSPNPVSGGAPIQLSVAADLSETVQVNIIDITGRVVSSMQISVSAGDQIIPISTNACSTGTYRLTLSNQRGIISKQFVVLE